MSKGITLIETIIALAIFAIGIVSTIVVFPMATETLERNVRSDTALNLAVNKIEEVTAKRYEELEEGTYFEDVGEIDGFENYQRSLIVSCFEPEGENCNQDTGIKKIEVIVEEERSDLEITLEKLVSER